MNADEEPQNIAPSAPGDGDPESTQGAAQIVSDDIARLEAELGESNTRTLRLMADFQNYQRRSLQNEQQARFEGVAKVVSSVVTVVDHFDLALTQDPAKATAEQIVAGVRVIRDELLKALAQHGVSIIRPNANDEFSPGRHEAIAQQPAEGVAPGHIVATFQAGYALAGHSGERVLRPAKVCVAPATT